MLGGKTGQDVKKEKILIGHCGEQERADHGHEEKLAGMLSIQLKLESINI